MTTAPQTPTRPTAAEQAPSLADLMHDHPRRAPVTLLLVAANVLVFLAMLASGAGWSHNSNAIQLNWGANFGPATQDGQWWRLGSAMFLHFGIVHLTLNMWALWDVGRLVERLYGRWRFALLYLASGVAGNLLSLVLQGNKAVSGGASGAVFSLYGALLVFLWRERRHVQRREFRWLFGFAVLFTLATLVMGLVVPGIDNAAHVGGLVCGALLAQVLARPWAGNTRVPPAVSRLAALGLLGIAVATLVTHIPPPTYRMGDELRAQAAIRKFLLEDRVLSQRWDSLIDSGRRERLSFDQLAGAIDKRVASEYQENFEELAGLELGAGAPSAKTLEVLRNYANLRSDASHALAEGLRTKDAEKIRKALETARQAPLLAQRAMAPASAASAASPATSSPRR
ncbi:MAG: rhomboid family intramembrane serine protease [Rhodoferax sp.]|nr:rhomboid family intramembrane serine protease [Rhodoferax sp.]